MNSRSDQHDREQMDLVFLYAMDALPVNEKPMVEAHISSCTECRQQIETLRRTIAAFVSWPTDLLRPHISLWEKLAKRIAAETGKTPVAPPTTRATKWAWEEPAPGIACLLLATDTEQGRVSMVVRLAPGAEYPPHRHAGVEELYLLDGELMIDDKKLYPGDYNQREADSVDHRIWTETGCTCVLLTSTGDVIL